MRWPPVTLTVGNVKVRIYTVTRADGYTFHQIADYTGGTRKLRSFASLPEARAEAERIARLLASGETTAARMRGTDAASYGRAVELLRQTGDPLELVAARYANAVTILGSGNLLAAACRDYARLHPASRPTVTIEAAIAELLAAKQGEQASADYLTDLKGRLGKLAAAFPNYPVASIVKGDVQRWLNGMKAAQQTKKNFRRVAITLFGYCEVMGYIATGDNPAKQTDAVRVKQDSVAIYSPKEIHALLAAAPATLVPALAIAAFAGVRTAEIMRLTWGHIDLAAGQIRLTPEITKTASRRVVPIQPNLAAWLTPYAQKAGRIWAKREWLFADALRKAAAAASVELKDNALRHSYASYRLAATQSAAQVSLEMGNSPQVVLKHYHELTKPGEAAAWFAVAPQTPANVVTLNQAAA